MLAPAIEAMLVPRSPGHENPVLARFITIAAGGLAPSDDRLWDDPSHNRTPRIRSDYGTADVTARRQGGLGETSQKKRRQSSRGGWP